MPKGKRKEACTALRKCNQASILAAVYAIPKLLLDNSSHNCLRVAAERLLLVRAGADGCYR